MANKTSSKRNRLQATSLPIPSNHRQITFGNLRRWESHTGQKKFSNFREKSFGTVGAVAFEPYDKARRLRAAFEACRAEEIAAADQWSKPRHSTQHAV
jgi:hypothetical protein